MSKVLVTGAAGFIGSHVTRQLVEQGRQVRALIRPGEKTVNIDDLPIERIEGDILSPETMAAAIEGCDTLYHLAAIYAVWSRNDKLIYDVNVRGSDIVLAAAKRAGVKKVVYTSSIAALGLGTKARPANETTPWNYGRLANAYIRSKHQGQLVAERYAREGLPVTIVNPAFPFGDQDVAPTPTGEIILNVLNDKVPVYFDGGFNVIDVRDVAAGHLLAEQKGKIGECYILGNRNITIHELYQLAAKVAGVKIPTRRVPAGLIAGIAVIAEAVSDYITHEPPLTTWKSVMVSAGHMHYDVSKAQRELGLAPRPIEEALERAIRWFRDNGYVENVRKAAAKPV